MMEQLPAPFPHPRTDLVRGRSPDEMPASAIERWLRPSLILVSTDLSDLDHLMPFAMEQAAQTGARLLLLHVLAGTAGMAADAAGMPYYDPAGALDFAARTLEPWRAAARQRNIACEILIREGNPCHQIGAVARQFRADRLLLGTRSRGKLGKLLLGSVAEQVLRSVNLPVITVGPEAHLQVDAGAREGVVLHATTLRETSRPSAALACQVAASQGARLLLIHVLPPLSPPSALGFGRSGQPASFDSAALQQLQRLAAETGGDCSTVVEPRVVHGNPSVEILAAASERKADLIVLGARHRSAFENLTRDRTIYRVLAHARCPVLTLREMQPGASAEQARQLTSKL